MEAETKKCPQCGHDNPADVIYCIECETRLAPRQPPPEPPSAISEESPDSTESTEGTSDVMTSGSTFAGQYQIIEYLGEGEMGQVYKVLDTKAKEEVVLKVLMSEIAPDDKTFRRYRKEFKSARKISHKNVCRLYHLGTSKGTRYITMEYVSGEDLKASMKRLGQFTAGKAIFTAKQICEGLAEGHRLGVIHRNLKPQNIMVDQFGNVRILDFGILYSQKTEKETTAGEIDATSEYMSPEQAEGQEVDKRSDIYSLGLILYEMLTNRLPYREDILKSLSTEHQIPEALSQLILKCLEREKEKRFQNTYTLFSELTKIETGVSAVEEQVTEGEPAPPKKTTARFDLQKFLIPGAIVVAAAIIALLVWQFFLVERAGTQSEGKPLIAVMYFENGTDNESLDFWREMISEALITDLNQSKYVDVMSSERLFQILNELNQLGTKTYSLEVLKLVAVRGEATHIISGSLAKEGDTIRIQVDLMKAQKDKTFATESEQGKGEESFFALVDGLTKKIKKHFKLKAEERAEDFDRDIDQITTKSLEAFKYYINGRRYRLMGEYRQSIDMMKEAVSIDPEFALAYRSMSVSYGNLGLFQEREAAFQKVLELSERLSEKEFYLIQGDYYRASEGTYGQAIEAYTKLLQLYPDHLYGILYLGTLYRSIEELDKALVYFEQYRKYKTEDIPIYFSIADVHMMKEQYEKAEEILRYCLNTFSDQSSFHHFLAFNYVCQGLLVFARNELDEASKLAPRHQHTLYTRGVYNTLTGAFVEAEEEYQKLIKEKEPGGQYLGFHGLANLCLIKGQNRESREYLREIIEVSQSLGAAWMESQARSILALRLMIAGNPQEALRECNKAWDLGSQAKRVDLQRLALHYKGLAYLKINSRTRAQQTAEELKTMIEEGSHQKEMRRYYHLVGMIELERKNYSQAIQHLETALSLLPFQSSLWAEAHLLNNQALYIDSLALAHYRAGNLDKAQEIYNQISQLTTGRLYFEDVYARSFYTLGRIFQRMGDSGKAEINYNKFLALWFDADSRIPEVNDAKRRLLEFNRAP
jgi:tetratricopeptide (TPR) repeat protein/tRNA A-37 threonylcarbamoyl transferase component Bud32